MHIRLNRVIKFELQGISMNQNENEQSNYTIKYLLISLIPFVLVGEIFGSVLI